MTEPQQAARPAWPWWLLLLASVAAGVWLRIWQLGDQILLDDEWHAIHKLLSSGMANIATHFGWADYSIPLTLYYRALYDLGWLSEWPMRLPLLLAGLALLLVPLAARRLPLPTRAVWAGLLAISLPLIQYSRTARPYALNIALVMLAVIAIHAWWHRGQRGWALALAYIVGTVLAGWLHLLTLPFTTLPFVWFGVQATRTWLRERDGRPFLRLLLLGIATLLPLLLALLPPLLGDWASMRAKAGGGAASWATGWQAMRIAFSNANGPFVIMLAVLAVLGAGVFWQRSRELLSYSAFLGVTSTALIVLADPAWIQHAGVLVRYAAPVLPALLLLLAQGLVSSLRFLSGRWLACPAAAAFGGLLYASGPLPLILYSPNQFMGHTRFTFDPDPMVSLIVTKAWIHHIPGFYRQLAELPPRSVTVVEAPWRLESTYNPLPWYQQLDRQYRKIGMTSPVCGNSNWGQYLPDQRGIHLSQFVRLGDLLAGERDGSDFLVLHMQPWTPIPPYRLRWPDMQQCLAKVTAALGRPVYRDAQIAAFNLRRPRPH